MEFSPLTCFLFLQKHPTYLKNCRAPPILAISRLGCQTACMFYVNTEYTPPRPCEFYSYDETKRFCELNYCSVIDAKAVSYSVSFLSATYVPTQGCLVRKVMNLIISIFKVHLIELLIIFFNKIQREKIFLNTAPSLEGPV